MASNLPLLLAHVFGSKPYPSRPRGRRTNDKVAWGCFADTTVKQETGWTSEELDAMWELVERDCPDRIYERHGWENQRYFWREHTSNT